MRVAAVVALYLSISVAVWGALNADMQYVYEGSPRIHADQYRRVTGSMALFAMLPIVWLMSPFMTGFYEHGWCLTRKQCHAEWPEGK